MIDTATRERIVLAAREFDGTPYIFGGNERSPGFDCSGGTNLCLRDAGCHGWEGFPATCDPTADMLWRACAPVGEDEHALPGDLGFYGVPTRCSHVVVVDSIRGVGADVIAAVWSASNGSPTCTTVAIAAARRARWRLFKSHLYRKDFLGFRRPWLLTGTV